MTVSTTDPKWVSDTYNPVEKLFLRLLKDERDMIFIRTSARIVFFLLPLAALLFASPPRLVAVLTVPYILILFLQFAGRYGLMLHAVGHRPIFRREYRFLEHVIPWGLGPFLGHTPTAFDAHHVFMHHAENNMLADASCTLAYKRDEFRQFLHYWARFFFTGYLHLPRYLYLRGRYKVMIRLFIGETAWLCIALAAAWVNWAAAIAVFVIPLLMMRWFLMAGNFAQHAFVDVDNPDDAFGNSNCLTNTIYNHKAYNDGYHIVHHMRAGMHWSEMAAWYENNVDVFADKDAVVFDGLRDNQHVWLLLMTKNYDELANHLVDFKGRSHEEKIAFMKGRLQRTIGAVPGFLRIESREDMKRTKRRKRLPAPEIGEAASVGAQDFA